MLLLGHYLLPNLFKNLGYLIHFDEETSFPRALSVPLFSSSLGLYIVLTSFSCAFPHITPIWVRMAFPFPCMRGFSTSLVDSD